MARRGPRASALTCALAVMHALAVLLSLHRRPLPFDAPLTPAPTAEGDTDEEEEVVEVQANTVDVAQTLFNVGSATVLQDTSGEPATHLLLCCSACLCRAMCCSLRST